MTRSPLAETTENQLSAADPDACIFVSANAGSGKTRVLTNRVARLLLAGATPERILCVTFTKAAAAEMSARLFRLLGDWSLAGDDELTGELAKLTGVARDRPADELASARRLFARALETPGGLKIQTIHSFCESVLKRFPLEADAPPGFAVLDDPSASQLLNEAIDEIVLAQDPARAADLKTVAERLGGADIRLTLKAEAKRSAADGRAGDERRLAAALGMSRVETPDHARRRFLASLNDAELARLREALSSGGKTAVKRGQLLQTYLDAMSDEQKYDALVKTALNADLSTPAGNIVDKKAAKADPAAADLGLNLSRAARRAVEEIAVAEVARDSAALQRLAAAVRAAYEALKRGRASLDFDDLIDKTRKLFDDRDRLRWVMYKLDQGLEHILLDEAQDTSPAAWSVIDGALAEFFAGEGAHEARRTFFAVGDQKQSIYGFQGADATLFQEKAADLGKKISPVAPFRNLPLSLSFRSSAPVLAFVDALFADRDVMEGVGADYPLRHGLYREGQAGLVELWPLTPRPEKPETRPWDAPLDQKSQEDPEALLADAVAGKIRGWLDNREMLASRNRPIRARDVLILVQSRGPLFHRMNAALTRAGVPSAGADRVKLLDDQGVKDVLSCARAALARHDNLSLAEALKSVFFEYSDDDLYSLACGRRGSLGEALEASAATSEKAANSVARLAGARKAAEAGPFAFLTYMLDTGQRTGWRRLNARLGAASQEPMEELCRLALDYERSNPRSLRGFLDELIAAGGDISRDTDASLDAVRVMTVHKAKGLEAPIVFILDSHRKKVDADAIVTIGDGVRAFAKSGGVAPAPTEQAIAAAQRKRTEEYRRLLYVAATRAEDRLYVCGVQPGNLKEINRGAAPDKRWYALAEDAFDKLGTRIEEGETLWARPVRRVSAPQLKPATPEATEASEPDAALAGLFNQHAAYEAPLLRLTPALLARSIKGGWTPIDEDAAAASPVDDADRLLRGVVLHKLLEILPGLPKERRRDISARIFARHAPDIDMARRAEWLAEATAVLDDPRFSSVFGEASRAELAIGGRPRGARSDVIVNGQIDRLSILPDRVLIVDYKTNRPPPRRVEDTPVAYIAQLAAYRALAAEIWPDVTIEAALLWTFEARLMPVPEKLMDDAFVRTLA